VTRLARWAVACALLMCAWPLGARGDASVSSLPQLLERFRGIEGLTARFTEEKHIALLAAPLTTHGTLHYSRTHEALARHTLKPSRSSVVVRDRVVRFGDGRTSRSLSVDDNPVARALVTTFLDVLRGDGDALEREFVVAFQALPEKGRWNMTLSPRDEAVRRVFKFLRFEGQGPRIQRLTIAETNGDRTAMRFDRIDLSRRYDDGDLRRVFSTGAP
jgi:hypothetical protein